MNESTVSIPRGIKHIHMVGIGGIGMSALAPELLRRGYHVTGSDPVENAVTRRLAAEGITISHEHQARNAEGASLVVASSAVRSENPELEYARKQHVPIWPRAKMLGALMQPYRRIIVTGTHGKTTITAMLTHMLDKCGYDPTAFIGGDVVSLKGNYRLGKGRWAVAEGDESDGSFTYLRPHIAVVNNIEADHMDHFKTIKELIQSFKSFLDGLEKKGTLVFSADCPRCGKLADGLDVKTINYGFSPHAEIQGLNYSASKRWVQCDVKIKGRKTGQLKLKLAGRSNIHNVLAVIAVGRILRIPFDDMACALKSFGGVQRRMEVKGEAHGHIVIDDYAHHPTELRATINALKERYQGRLIGVFQPHLYSRTLHLQKEFEKAFEGLDLLVLTDIYPAREEPVPGVNGEILLKPVRRNGVQTVYLPDLNEIPVFLRDIRQPGDTVVTLGAGDVWKAGECFLRLLTMEREVEKG